MFVLILAVLLIFVAIFLLPHYCERDYEKDTGREYGPLREKLVLIPEGYFLMGKDRDDGALEESPIRRVWLDRFFIGRYEVTNAEFSEFVRQSGAVWI
jgi:formylglycine-generating enzyme required for sulfatase activity